MPFKNSAENDFHVLVAGTREHKMMIRVLTILLISFSTFSHDTLCQEQRFIPYHLLPGSRLWIDGTATLGPYTCETVAVYGSGGLNADLDRLRETSLSHQADNGGVQVFILVKMFNCGNPAMNADMYHALHAERDSAIQYTLLETHVMYDSIAHNGWLGLQTVGKLSIAGITKTDTIAVRVKSLRDRKYEILGKKELSMLDFHITPPSAFFGLIKADERLVVNFDLIAGPDRLFTEQQDNNHTQ
jgi:hypothetical protein